MNTQLETGELTVVTVRSGTTPTEAPPPVGVEIPLQQNAELEPGLGRLVAAAEHLIGVGVLEPQPTIVIRDMPHGHLFVCRTAEGDRVPFYECFGHFIEVLTRKSTATGGDKLLIIAPPRRGSLRRLLVGDTTRKLALDLHRSLLGVRGGGPDSRFLVCADGSPSARRQFPMVRHLLRAIGRPLELV